MTEVRPLLPEFFPAPPTLGERSGPTHTASEHPTRVSPIPWGDRAPIPAPQESCPILEVCALGGDLPADPALKFCLPRAQCLPPTWDGGTLAPCSGAWGGLPYRSAVTRCHSPSLMGSSETRRASPLPSW